MSAILQLVETLLVFSCVAAFPGYHGALRSIKPQNAQNINSEAGTVSPVIAQDDVARLMKEGFVEINDFLAPVMVKGLRRDVDLLRKSSHSLMTSATPKHGRVEWFELLPSRQPKEAGGAIDSRTDLYRAVEDLRVMIGDAAGVKLEADLTELKFAYYPFGGSYQRHLDALNVGDVAREFSFIIYLNEGWTENDGGHLRVYEYLGQSPERRRPFFDVKPTAGTIVVFKSDAVPHEVLATSVTRVALVGWFHRTVSPPEVDTAVLSPLALAILAHYEEKGQGARIRTEP